MKRIKKKDFGFLLLLLGLFDAVLDSSHMKHLNRSQSAEDHRLDYARRRLAEWIRRAGTLEILLLLFTLATALHAQQTSTLGLGNLGGSQTPSNPDCSDPLMAASSECALQGEQQPYLPGASPSNSALAAALAAQRGTSTGNYSDIQRLNQQGVGQTQQVLLPPQMLTEFQKFVASTTGQVLPIYGAELFRSVPSTFAPLNLAPVPLDYVLGPGDELRIRVWGQVNLQDNVRVDRSGDIFLPQIGPVHVEGLPYSQLNAHLRDAIGRVYRNFDLTADVGQTRAIQIYVAGQARRPGVYTVSSLSTLVDALFASGGPTVEGSMRHVELRRDNKVITDFDLYALLAHGDKSKDVKLLPGDVIFIPPVGPQVALTGSVRNPGIYELRSDESLAGLLADAGGVSSVAARARVSIERIEDHTYRSAMEVAYDATGLATTLRDGDIVRVFSVVPSYRKTVILRGNTANPGRFAWRPGMRVSDLIPDKDSLITRNYWWRRAQLGLPTPEFEPMPALASMRQPQENNPVKVQPAPLIGSSGPNQMASLQGQGAQNQSQNGNSQNPSGSAQNQSGYNQTQGEYEQNQYLSAQQNAGGTSLAATQSSLPSQAAYQAQRTTIRQLAADIDWSYAAIERLDPHTLKTTVIPFDLGKLVLQHDASQDIALQPGDVVTIFSDADIRVPLAQQTKLVTLEGEFLHAGVYSVEPGETLRHLVERAGGLTPSAYLYGSEFTRESTRRVQQARIDEYVQDLSMRMQQGALAVSAQDIAARNAAQSSEHDLIANLRQIRATGRIVLPFAPAAVGTTSLPGLALENGDHFIVPSVPATVNVVGAVYDQNSFLYKQGLRAGVYLHEAGGPIKDADRHHEFIIRADGEVVSRDSLRTIWGDEFTKLRIHPGDTIVVPAKTFKPSALAGFSAWSQVFSQLALGAAAVNVIK